ncbi:hypothetical protein M419DRAFT_95626 [Trichoderma reesei RUT C-30]|uniref:J domain-containing protein n=1 Tax=Hypocrea jecorina (strain ATCC 56765 / BCRC 32924 / NRRL 11460 / Rut C-30) TaxID=1344414 RepID=A0A024SLL5_HYPJR|nr:hypothetical protein M419DRAFT_95626 [Trichoderma reesei RUT C-30]
MAPQRDYYADLGLTPSADIVEIKKQFRKLALKYHPDRNPGREQEVNSQFQVIQAAHEILSDPEAKAKYDATLLRSASSRYPTASGVRGNPWSNVSQQFPVPPRRNAPRTTTSGPQRWNERFSAGVPPTAKQQQQASAATAARAFESMRKGGAKGRPQDRAPPPPPPRNPPTPPPRTEAAKKRAEASFGAKKAGYYPRSNTPGDEPPVTNNNYSSRTNSARTAPAPNPEPVADPLAQFRQWSGNEEAARNAAKNASNINSGGERTNPFGSTASSRARSTKEPSESAGPSTAPKLKETGEPTMYATPVKPFPYGASSCPKIQSVESPQRTTPKHNMAEVGPKSKLCGPSGKSHAVHNLSPFEQEQYQILKLLIKNRDLPALTPRKESLHSTPYHEKPAVEKSSANSVLPNSFSFNLDEEAFTPSPPRTSKFRKSTSADGINTTFVEDESSATWQFSAGSGDNNPPPLNRSQSDSRAGRRSPIKRRPVPSSTVPDSGAQAPQNGFDAESWNSMFGPQTFAPPPATPKTSVSPTRQGRSTTRKTTRTTRPLAGNAAIVEEYSEEEERYVWTGRKKDPKPATVDSPQAMDIDPPLTASPAAVHTPTPPPPGAASSAATPATTFSATPPATQPHPQPHPHAHPTVARNIPVEPSRPEWRPGNVTGLGQAFEQAEERKHIPVNLQGSEDSEEFRATFEDLKNVAPFAPPKTGLKSFTDLKDSLPFESKASSELHLDVPQAHPLVFPEPPVAPRLPPTVAVDGVKPNVASWSKYLEEFEGYLRLWDMFNSQVVDHFATRKSNILHTRASKGYSFLAARGDADVMEYHNWVEQDNGVRRRWLAACEEHEVRFREFMAFREKMKSTT